MDFTAVGEIANIETFAIGRRIRELKRLRRKYGKGRWRKRKGFARVRLVDGVVKQAELHWYEGYWPTRVEDQAVSRLSIMANTRRQFAVCVRNEGYEASLELRKIYEVLSDAVAARHRQIRVIDESGEDYLFPASWFTPIALPAPTKRAILAAV